MCPPVLGALDDVLGVGEQPAAARVVVVQVGVDDEPDVGRGQAHELELLGRVVPRLHAGSPALGQLRAPGGVGLEAFAS